MNYLGITTTELQATNDKPYIFETRPIVFEYLEQALAGKRTESQTKTGLPDKYFDLLNQISGLTNGTLTGLLSYQISAANNEDGLYSVTKTPGSILPTKSLITIDKIHNLITQYLTVLTEVMPTYITSVLDRIRSSQNVQLRNVNHNQMRYVQTARATNPSVFTIKLLSDLDLYSFTTCASVESLLIIEPLLPLMKYRSIFDKLQLNDSETVSYDKHGGLIAKPIVPKNGLRIRLLLKESMVTRTINLGFLNAEESPVIDSKLDF